MSEEPDPGQSVKTTGDITLVLGQRTTGVRGLRLAMHTDVESEIREICEATKARLDALTPVAYTNDLDFTPQDQYVVVPNWAN